MAHLHTATPGNPSPHIVRMSTATATALDDSRAALLAARAALHAHRGPFASFSWQAGKRGGRYWLPDGKEDVARNRLYGKRAEAASNAKPGGATTQAPRQRAATARKTAAPPPVSVGWTPPAASETQPVRPAARRATANHLQAIGQAIAKDRSVPGNTPADRAVNRPLVRVHAAAAPRALSAAASQIALGGTPEQAANVAVNAYMNVAERQAKKAGIRPPTRDDLVAFRQTVLDAIQSKAGQPR